MCVSLLNQYSPNINISAVGLQNKFTIFQRLPDYDTTAQLEFVCTTSLSLALPNEYIYTKVVTFAPRFVLVNLMSTPLHIVQHECYMMPERLKENERMPFHWVDSNKKPLLSVRAMEEEDSKDASPGTPYASGSQWDWSCGFKIDELGVITVQNRHITDQFTFKIIKIDRKLVEVKGYCNLLGNCVHSF